MSYWKLFSTATTVGKALMALANPSAIRFPRINADNSVTALSASDFSIATKTSSDLTADGAISIIDNSIVYLSKTSAGAFTIAAPSSQDNTTITVISTTDFAHVVTFTGGTLWDGTSGVNTTGTFPAFAGSAFTIVAKGAFWYTASVRLVTFA